MSSFDAVPPELVPNRRAVLRWGALGGVALALGGCGAPASGPTATTAPANPAAPAVGGADAVLAAAKAEGTLTWYTSVPPPALNPLVEAFTARHGITVEVNRQTSSTLATLFQTEVTSGNHVADVIGTSDTAIMFPAVDDGSLAALPAGLAAVAGWPEKWARTGRGATYMQAVGVYTIAYNTQVAGDAPPKTWESLLDPRWRGQIMMTDPRATAGCLGWLVALMNTYGDSFLQRLGEQQIKLTNSTATGINSVAAGDVGILVPSSRWNNTELIAKGAPIDDAYPEPAMGGSEQWFGLISGAPHPNAGALFIDFTLSDEGQSAMCGDLCSSVTNAPGTMAFPASYATNDLDKARQSQDKVLQLLKLA